MVIQEKDRRSQDGLVSRSLLKGFALAFKSFERNDQCLLYDKRFDDVSGDDCAHPAKLSGTMLRPHI
jgi:hypothetical protein